jgi:hypothetical protein
VLLASNVSKASKAGVAGLPKLLVSDFIGDAMDPNRGEKVSVLGDKARGSQDTEEYTVLPAPPMPNPSGSSGMGVGGVGVRGGAGIGRLEAIVADYRLLRSIGRYSDRQERRKSEINLSRREISLMRSDGCQDVLGTPCRSSPWTVLGMGLPHQAMRRYNSISTFPLPSFYKDIPSSTLYCC